MQSYSTGSGSLKDVLLEKVPAMQEEVKAFRKKHGKTTVGQVTVDMVRNLLSFKEYNST